MIKIDFSYFLRQLWWHVHFSAVREDEWEATEVAPLRVTTWAWCHPARAARHACTHSLLRVWMMHGREERFVLRYQSEQWLRSGTELLVCLFTYLNCLGLPRPRGGEPWTSAEPPDLYLLSHFHSLDFEWPLQSPLLREQFLI